MSGRGSNIAFKLISAVLAIPISRAIRKAIAKAWTAARPNDPPHDPRAVDTDWRDALVWAVLTGVGAAVAQLLTTKGADTVWRALTGSPSPRPEPSGNKDESAA
jgi:hypothetical protein